MSRDAQMESIARATEFLRGRLRSGAYGLSCVGPDGTPRFSDNKGHVFVGFFVAEAMSGLLDEIDRTILLVRILSEEHEGQGQWGFSPPGPYVGDEVRVFLVDSDDTAYVLRTLRRLGINRPARGLLPFYREHEKLFVTFNAPGGTALSLQPSPSNNLLAHLEVNANVFLALRGTNFENLVNYELLREAQDARGFWPSYFYPSPLFATVLALDLLTGNAAFASEIERALKFLLESQNAEGSWGAAGDAFDTALAVSALAGFPAHADSMNRGVSYLLASMAADGSWESKSCVWEFHADDHDVWRAHDTHRTFTSAMCSISLRRAAGQLHSL
jgi:hypothetical protein